MLFSNIKKRVYDKKNKGAKSNGRKKTTNSR